MGKTIGIDLGTTNSVVAIIENGVPKVLTNAEGSYTTPSVVGFGKKGEILVGQIAKRQAVSNPDNTIFSSKRFIGRLFSEIKTEAKDYPFKTIKKSGAETCSFEINGEEVSPEKIASLILSKLKKDAESYIGQKVTEAVITVPAYFNDSQRQATKDAGKVAGLNIKRIVNEPTAAALAYGLDKKKDQVIAVYDFGGGTFDVSILEVTDQLVEVKATNGDTQLGGDDFDQIILNWLAEEFKKNEGIDLKKDKMALQRLREAAEKAKIELSSVKETSINLPFITANESGAKHLDISLTRAKLNQLTDHLVEKTLIPCKVVLKDADIAVEDIDEVIMVGGSTRIIAVKEAVKKFFNKELNLSVNPDQVVAQGAAVQAGILSNEIKDVLLLDVTPLSLGIETLGGVMTPLISKNTTIPTKKSETFSTAENNQTTVSIHVLQGERSIAKDNKTLGNFDLRDIPPAPRGVPKIEVSFDIDSNGIIHVSAKNQTTGATQKLRIDKPSLSAEEIDQMVKSAKIYEDQDRKRKEIIGLKNELDQMIYNSEKLITDNKDKLTEDMQEDIEKLLQEAKDFTKKEDSDLDVDSIKSMTEKLENQLKTLGSHIYKQSAEDDKTKKEEAKSEDVKQKENEDQETVNVDFKKKEH